MLPLTVTYGRRSEVPGAAIACATSQALAPRGSRQKFSDVVPVSGPTQAMYAVPAASSAAPGP